MTKAEPPRDAADAGLPPVAQAYQVIGLAAAVVLGAALFQYGTDRWALVPVLIGAAGLAFRWRTAPPACLAAVAFALIAPAWVGGGFSFRRDMSIIPDLLIGLSLVTYALAQYRLLSLTVGVLPPDPLRPKIKPVSRPAETVSRREVPMAIVTALGAALAARFLWELTTTDLLPPPWGIPAPTWHVTIVLWILAALLFALFAVLGYLGWRRQSPDEATLFLRDMLWAETRREQRRAQRWTAWARRKAAERPNRPAT